jgi:hypothetical protein
MRGPANDAEQLDSAAWPFTESSWRMFRNPLSSDFRTDRSVVMRMQIARIGPLSLALLLPLLGCGLFGKSESDESGPPDKVLQNGGAPLSGVKQQREWEAEYASLEMAWTAASQSGNQLVAKDTERAFDEFQKDSLKAGVAVSGWMGVASDIRETSTKYPDEKGQPALTATVWLSETVGSDYDRQTPRIRIVNYDLKGRKSTGLVAAFKALKNQQLVRVWGRMQLSPDKYSPKQELAVTRLEPVDLAQERKELLAKVKEVEEQAANLDREQKSLLEKVYTGPRDWVQKVHHLCFCSQLAATYPDYQQAVKSFNAYEPFDLKDYPQNCRKWTTMLTSLRFMDPEEPSRMEAARMALEKPSAAAAEQRKNLQVIVERIAQGKREYEKLKPHLNDDPDGIADIGFRKLIFSMPCSNQTHYRNAVRGVSCLPSFAQNIEEWRR